jgi:GDP-L-fucose synthase
LRKFHDAKISKSSEVIVWGSGKPLREFMHCDDLASALLFLLKGYSDYEHINVGSGDEVSIRELVDVIAEVVGFEAKIIWDKSKPDGTPRKLMDTSNLHNLGWKDHRSLFDGISHTYESWLSE